MVLILSIDGGGIRGLIPALVLAELDKRYKAKGGTKPFCQIFKLIAGTSTGGIIAAGLCAPSPSAPKAPAMTPDDLVTLYRNHGATIFDTNLFRRIRSYVEGAKYDAGPLEGLLQQYLGDARMSDALGNVMITAYDISARETVFMKGSTPGDAGNYLMWEAARGTSAAPTFFEPARVTNLATGVKRTLVDGGVFNNDPALSAYVEGIKMGVDAGAITLVSLGTGDACRGYSYNETRHWGAIDWMSPGRSLPVLSIMMHGQASSADHHLRRLLNDGTTRYYRLQTDLEDANDDMDDATPGNLEALANEAQRIIAAKTADLDAIVALMLTQ